MITPFGEGVRRGDCERDRDLDAKNWEGDRERERSEGGSSKLTPRGAGDDGEAGGVDEGEADV